MTTFDYLLLFHFHPFSGSYKINGLGFEDDQIRKDLRRAVVITRKCRVEIIMKDNHTLGNKPQNVMQWYKIAKRELEGFNVPNTLCDFSKGGGDNWMLKNQSEEAE